MKIAFVVHDYNRRYGHSRYVAELATRFKADHEIHVFANTVEEPDRTGLTFHYVPAIRRNVMTTLLSFAFPATWMVDGRYDIIHSQGFCGFRQNVVTAHICQGAWLAALTRYSGTPGWRKRVFHTIAGWFERRTFSTAGARRVIAVSHRIADDLQKYYNRSIGVRVVHHGVDSEIFHPRNRLQWRAEYRRIIGVSEDTPLALYVGDYQKGLKPTIQAVARVPGLHLVGIARSPIEPYREWIETEGVVDRIHLLPPTGNVERYYAAADLLVFPTFYDPFGLVATEAMASGLPVICSAEAGAAEVIDHGVNGLIVQNPWDPEALAEQLRNLVDDPILRRRIGDAGRHSAEAMTWDEVAIQTMTVYREVASQHSPSNKTEVSP